MRTVLLSMQYFCIFGLIFESWIIFKKLKGQIHLYLLFSCVTALIANLGYLLELNSKTEDSMLMSVQFAYLGRTWYAFFLFLFVTSLGGFKVPEFLKRILMQTHILIYLAILTMPGHNLYYKDIVYRTDGLFSRIEHGNGPIHHLLMALQFFYIVFGMYALIRGYLREKKPKTKRSILVVIISVCIQSLFFLIQIAHIGGLSDIYDVTALGYFIGTIVMLIAIVSFDLLGMNDIAKEMMIDRISEGIIAVDNNGIVQYYNEPAAGMYPKLSIDDKIHGEQLAEARKGQSEIIDSIKKAIAEGKNIEINDRIYGPEENDIIHNGENFGKLYALADETDHIRYMDELRQQREIADSANEAKSRFLANMSHEIRTPINAVLGMDEMILRESQEKSIRTYAADIMSAGKTLLSLINDILDFSKVEEGKMEIIPVQYDLSSLINDLVNMIRDRAAKKGLKFVVDVDRHIPHLLHGDEIRIKQCVMNLLTNAVKYTEKGTVTLRVTFTPAEKGKKSVMLGFAVEDTGIGMKQEDMDKLFSPYKRIEEKRNRLIEGTGLGMSITRQLLELMHGKLEVQSEYGKGSCFSFEVKQKVISWQEIGDYSDRLAESSENGPAYHELFHAPDARILVVDDTEMNLTVIRSLLKKTEIRIDTAERGRDALTLAAGNQYDAIFIDHMMPDMDGIETLEHLRESGKNTETPAIALTANAVSGAREMYLNAGFTDYLSKPVDGAKLEKLLSEVLPAEKLQKPVSLSASDTAGNTPETSRILVIDDDETVRELVRGIMEPQYSILTANSGAEGVKAAKDNIPDLIMLDVHLTDLTGFEVMQRLNNESSTAEIPVLLITGDHDSVTEENAFKSGAADFIRKPFVPDILKQRAKRLIDLFHYQQYIENEVEKQTNRSRRLSRDMMLVLSKTVDTKDHYTDGHSRRVAALCAEMGRRLGKTDKEQIMLYEIGLLHDIGKIGIHEDIIHKNTRLSDDEFAEVKAHTVKGYEILKEITDMPMLCEGARWHHERYDGTGYPDGLKGEEIPESARIACIADCYDAMTSTRTYSVPKKQEDVRAEIVRCSGKWFDPAIADVMLAMIDEDTEYKMNENAKGSDVWKEYDRLWDKMRTQDSEAKPESQLPGYLLAIDGLDCKTGVKNCGSPEDYVSVLSVFKKTAGTKADEIEQSLTDGDIAAYTIKVHALKSSARIIGAAELSKLAEQLEAAGKNNDRAFIDANTGRLLGMYRELDKALDGGEEKQLPAIGAKALKEAYQTMYEIAQSMDYELMDGILSDLRGYSFEPADEERISAVEKLLTELDWDGISALVKEVI
ncbi:MAG: response regulator [Lachnospiraceae bacterium]|nr:response regulator [Lachnospiraceae bacterium]